LPDTSGVSILERLAPLFYPRSIAIVGASRDERKPGFGFVRGLLEAGFKGPVYPVNPAGGEIAGLKVYPRLTDIPGPVDYVTIAVPAAAVPPVLDECAAKGVKVVHLFTGGYSELSPEGQALEQELVRRAREGGFRILGPNCMGVYSPEVGKVWTAFQANRGKGVIGVITQGGSIGNWLQLMAGQRGLPLGKMVHYGNGCDIECNELLEYFAADPETRMIACYLEGVKDGRAFFERLRQVTPHKPVVVWKAGFREAGARAAASHTGSLVGSEAVWSAALRQANAIQVESLEEMVDVLLALDCLAPFRGRAAALVCGVCDGGGGESVSSGDGCIKGGLEVPPFSSSTVERLKDVLGEVGSILVNPLDVSQRFGRLDALKEALETAAADPGVDLLIIGMHLELLTGFLPAEVVEGLLEICFDFRQRKPLAVSMPPAPSPDLHAIELKLNRSRIPVFPTVERAARAIGKLSHYFRSLP